MRSLVVSAFSVLFTLSLITLAGVLYVLVAQHQLSNGTALFAGLCGVLAWFIGSHELESFRTPRRRASDRRTP